MAGKFKEYNYIKKFAAEKNIERIFFLDIDQYQIPIGFSRDYFKVGGIYFRPFHRVNIITGTFSGIFKNLAYKIKKRAIFSILKFNKKVEAVYLLNDEVAAKRLPKFFKYLPDPVFINPAPIKTSSLRENLEIGVSAHIFLVFGAISARKNIRHIINAFKIAQLEKESILLITGKIRNDYRTEFNSMLRQFEITNKDRCKRIIVRDEFVDEAMMDSYFMESDTIVLCYQKFYGSSGLLGRAALYNKTVIVANEGLLNDLCAEYNLGYSCSPRNIYSIAKTFSKAAKNVTSADLGVQYLETHKEQAFINALLSKDV